LHLASSGEGGFMLRHTKTNFGPLHDPIAYTLAFHERAVNIEQISVADDRVASIAAKTIGIRDQIRAAFESGSITEATAQDVADRFEIPAKTAMNRLRELVTKGILVKDGKVWRTVAAPVPFPTKLPRESQGKTAS
jgi:hypothetical protein